MASPHPELSWAGTDPSIGHLLPFLAHLTLPAGTKRLALPDNPIDGVGLGVLGPKLAALPTIEHLDLSANDCTAADVAALPRLRDGVTIDLRENPVTDEGRAVLEAAHSNVRFLL